jgi:hypothetical protein
MQTRPIKSLSDQQVADLKAGRGMGLSLPAELNGHPGPAHVLELAGQLRLSADQKARVQSQFDSKQPWITCSPAIQSPPIGLKTITAKIGVTQAALRDTHLKYHLQTAQILTPEQMQQYSVLRGYGSHAMMLHHHNMQ